MRNKVYRVIAVLGMLFGMAFASAQAQTPSKVEVNIPFEFSAGKTEFKPGVYSIKRMSGSLLMLRSPDGKSAILNAPITLQSKDAGERLVFNKYEDRYVLSQVWLSGVSGRQISQTGEHG